MYTLSIVSLGQLYTEIEKQLLFFTARVGKRGKVMFSHACVTAPGIILRTVPRIVFMMFFLF